jgi:pimeloyl-ACP methyl ester carboxylesterase
MNHMFWKWLKRIGLGFLCLIGLLLMVGAAYQWISTKLDARRYPAPGQLVDIGGYKLHLYSAGSGGPAVILDSGLGGFSSSWGLVQPKIAQFTQVVSYDRAGTGWSEPSPFSRTSQQIVLELHTLLQNAHIPKPYILVGHSFGGINVRLYAATYSDEVLGLVLVDSSHESQEKKLPPHPMDIMIPNPMVTNLISRFGVSRLLMHIYFKDMFPSSLPQSMRNVHLAIGSTTKHICTVFAESRVFNDSLNQLACVDQSCIQDKPCFVLTAGLEDNVEQYGISTDKKEPMQRALTAFHKAWNDLQNDLADKFHHSHHLIAEKSDHMIPLNQPELIVESVKQMIEHND